MASLNVVALISGGKDSFFSILHCQVNGHRVLALANLHPPTQDAEDLDSFMYQTIGHAMIPLYEEALELPVYRQEIRGTATIQDRDYHPGDTVDETESLVPLLHKVLAAHPEINAVSTGAILSDYQRTRVESVALRLGLTPLSYLWQWPSLPPQTSLSLLEDMAAVGQDSRIIKVASGGLDESFLWRNVAEPRTRHRLNKAAERFGTSGDGAVLGEGGEFETLAIDGPAPLWKGRITISPEDVEVVPGEAGSASLKLRNASVVLHDAEYSRACIETKPRVPPLLDPAFGQMLELLQSKGSLQADDVIEAFSQAPASAQISPEGRDLNSHILADLTGDGVTAAMQTKSVMEKALTTLARMGHSIHDVANTIIVLRDMADFTSVNPVYGSYFSKPKPPARITVACADVLPSDALLSISVTVLTGKREGLHVQSRSYWAPANIGPYSQAIKQTWPDDMAHSHVYVAGQIPLIPASMQLPDMGKFPTQTDASFVMQSVLALQHLERIARVMKVNQWAYGIAFVASSGIDQQKIARYAGIARHAWKEYHLSSCSRSACSAEVDEDQDEEFDVWDQQRGSGKAAWQSYPQPNPIDTARKDRGPGHIPRMTVVTTDALPRGADIEWVGFGQSTANQSCSVPAHLASLLRTFQHRILP